MLVQTTEGLVSKCGFELQYFFFLVSSAYKQWVNQNPLF